MSKPSIPNDSPMPPPAVKDLSLEVDSQEQQDVCLSETPSSKSPAPSVPSPPVPLQQVCTIIVDGAVCGKASNTIDSH